MTARLEVEGLVAGYGDGPVVHGVDLHVDEGEVVALLGPNGAGKSTTLLAISGLLPHLAGTVHFDGRPLDGRRARSAKAAALARAGLVHVPEDRGLFPDLTVAEHLRIARPRRARPGATLTDAEVYDRLPALAPLAARPAGLLSGGEQQMLALAKALAVRPKVLLVDELSLGLAPLVVERLLPVLRQQADEAGTAVVVVEQHVALALEIADRAALLDRGRITVSGTAAELAARPDLLESGYLGPG